MFTSVHRSVKIFTNPGRSVHRWNKFGPFSSNGTDAFTTYPRFSMDSWFGIASLNEFPATEANSDFYEAIESRL